MAKGKPKLPPQPSMAAVLQPSCVRLQFVLGAGWSSRLIAWYGQGYGGFSHVDAVLPDGSLLGARYDRCGGQEPGVRIRPQGYERWLRRTLVTVPCTAQQAAAWQRWLRGELGKQYDPQAIWAFALGLAPKKDGRWICSACQNAGLRDGAQLAHASSVPDSQVTPDALYQIATEGLGGRFEELSC